MVLNSAVVNTDVKPLRVPDSHPTNADSTDITYCTAETKYYPIHLGSHYLQGDHSTDNVKFPDNPMTFP